MNNDTFSYLNLNNNISDMFFEENSSIFLCIYNISFIKEDLPFIQYLLYKQELQLNNKKHRLASFPYIHFEENREKTLINIKNLVTNLTEEQLQFNGFIKDNSNFYLFYNHLHPIQNKTYNLTDNIIWGTIHEIVNQQKILDCTIHYNTFELFLKHTKLLHIRNNDGDNIIIPYVIISKIPKNTCILDEIEKYDEESEMFYIKEDIFSNKYDTIRHVAFLYFNSEIGEGNYIYKENKYFFKNKKDTSILSINHKN